MLLAVAVALVIGGCSDSDDVVTEEGATETLTFTLPVETAEIGVYFLRDGKVWPTRHEVTGGIESAAVAELLRGPTEQEAGLGFTSAVPEALESLQMTVADGVARVEPGAELPPAALAQVVYTLTQFRSVRSVHLADGNYALTGFDRADFEDFTPAILVESPLSFEEVTSPLRVTGTANTFEANFQYELKDADGKVRAKDFVTATSGTGTRGTFEFTAPFDFEGDGTLIVFESSAKDGSRINVAEIPVRLNS